MVPENSDSFESTYSGLDPNIVGRVYEGSIEIVDPDKVIAYAKATNETNSRYFESDIEKLLIPPIFPVTMLIEPMKRIVLDDSLNLDIFRMVHGEHEILYYRPLKIHDQVNTSIKLESIDIKESGDILWAKSSGKVEEELVFEMRAGLFFRKPRKESKKRKETKKDKERQVIVCKQMKVTSDQSVRYAAASGDDNPIHVDRDVAMSVGLPDKILHGLCTLAFATQAIMDNLAEGDPRKVKRIKSRFSKPVFMNDTLTTEAWLLEENETCKVFGFETKNEAGEAVLKLGSIELFK
ncbi:MAG: MaoC/PaaZ C-terminal domain-containing protein [Promethearchaeota archaeon]